MTIILVIALAIFGWWAYNYGPAWFSRFLADALKQTINDSELPADEKADINVQIDRVATEFREGRLSGQQFQKIVEGFVESPLMTSMSVWMIDKQYIDKSGLAEDEKAEGRTAVRRFMRGMVDRQIAEAGIDAAMQHVAVRQSDGSWKLLEQVSDEQLRSFFKEAKKQADRAEIPPEPEDIDPSDEFKRIVDEALLGEAAGAPDADAPDANDGEGDANADAADAQDEDADAANGADEAPADAAAR
jgi:hypothetical protein